MGIQDPATWTESQQGVRYGVEESAYPLFTGLYRFAGAQLSPEEVEMIIQGCPVNGAGDETIGSGVEGARDGFTITGFCHDQDVPARLFGQALECCTESKSIHLVPRGSEYGEIGGDFLDALEDFGSIPNLDDISP
jgi:hypothetical protein